MTDPTGNVYFSAGYCVFKLNPAGTLTLVAGNSHRGYSGDGGPATSAQLDYPRGLALDGAGNLYITDKMNNRIRRVSPSGTITTVAGTGAKWFAGDGGGRHFAALYQPEDVAVDGAGNLYIADQMNNRIRRVSTAGILTTFAGTGDHGFFGDGGPATSAWLSWPSGIAADSAGHIYIADTENNRVRRVSPSGSISTVATDFARPRSLAVESTGNLLVTDTGRSRVVRVQFGGVIGIITVAGTGDAGFSGDGGPAISAQLAGPEGVAADAAGNVYIADTNNNRIRRVLRPTPFFGGGISTVAGDGTNLYSGDGGPATSAQMAEPYGVAVDASGNLYITDYGNFSVRRVSPSGVITTAAAGPGISGMSGPVGVAADGAGNLYIADGFYRVHRVSPDGTLTEVAVGAGFNAPYALALDAAGNLYIADMGRNRVVRVSPEGSFTTVAGTGAQGYSGDGGPATLARLSGPRGVAVDGAGNLYISDSGNYRLRRVSPDGTITTMAGTGTPGFSGDGGPAASAQLIGPTGVGLDGAGNIYIADTGNHRVRRISPSGTIATIAGTGVEGYSGDGVPACDHNVKGTTRMHSHVIYSDDRGATWKIGGIAGEKTNESAMAELRDGSLLLNMRSYHGTNRRAIARSSDGGLTWQETTLDDALIDPVCQGSLVRAVPAARKEGDGRLLFSNAASTKRERMTVRLSRDDGRTWPVAKVIHEGPAAYSSLVVLPDRSVGLLYERGERRPYERITFAHFGLDWLTGRMPQEAVWR